MVLAGGAGRRMGGDKPQRLYQARALGEHALSLAASFANHVALSVRERRQADELPPVQLLFDSPKIEGPLAGVASGLAHGAQIGAAHVLTIPCDAPHLPDDLYTRLEEALVQDPDALAASAGDSRQGHPTCTLWRIEALEPLLCYAQSGRRSLRGLLVELNGRQVVWEDPRGQVFLNLNTPEDLTNQSGQMAARAVRALRDIDQGWNAQERHGPPEWRTMHADQRGRSRTRQGAAVSENGQ
ncbi:MAG: molybdenum cofactor guanylyltransferase [Phenylobacterium sp.]|nr:molybdenum cofactor guanylyltransferase [Phenylobacterium sp.]